MAGTFNPIKFVEDEAAWHRYEPRMIVEIIHREAEPGTDFDQLCTDFEARITELSEMAKTHPDHAKLSRGIDTMRKVAQLLTPSGAEAELSDLANKIRVCVDKSDNYAATAGRHLRAARERCREIGLDFNKWCAPAELGIKRSRIYQLMGPDPIAANRRDETQNAEPEENHTADLENIQSVDIAQSAGVEQTPPLITPEEPEIEAASVSPQRAEEEGHPEPLRRGADLAVFDLSPEHIEASVDNLIEVFGEDAARRLLAVLHQRFDAARRSAA